MLSVKLGIPEPAGVSFPFAAGVTLLLSAADKSPPLKNASKAGKPSNAPLFAVEKVEPIAVKVFVKPCV